MNYQEILDHAKANGRNLGRTRLFEDIKAGKLKRQPDGSFEHGDVNLYVASLPMATISLPDMRGMFMEESDMREFYKQMHDALTRLATFTNQFEALQKENAELRHENATLKQQLGAASAPTHQENIDQGIFKLPNFQPGAVRFVMVSDQTFFVLRDVLTLLKKTGNCSPRFFEQIPEAERNKIPTSAKHGRCSHILAATEAGLFALCASGKLNKASLRKVLSSCQQIQGEPAE